MGERPKPLPPLTPTLSHLTCPTPGKRGFSKKKQAKRQISRMKNSRHRDDVHPYRCACGLWHNGHTPGVLHKREAKKRAKRPREES